MLQHTNQKGSSNMTFTTKKLVGHRVMVTGTDSLGTSGTQVLDSAQWESLSENKEFKAALEAYDAAVKDHFSGITEAAERLEAARSGGDADPLTYVVTEPGIEGTVGRPERRTQLSHDSQVLRVLESGDHDRLVWVNETLEIATVETVGSSGNDVLDEPAVISDEDAFVSIEADEV